MVLTWCRSCLADRQRRMKMCKREERKRFAAARNSNSGPLLSANADPVMSDW